jgi:hypothetical protein
MLIHSIHVIGIVEILILYELALTEELIPYVLIVANKLHPRPGTILFSRHHGYENDRFKELGKISRM